MGNRRTTVTLDDSLAFFMALNLGHEPRTLQAKQAIRQWLQAKLDEHGDPGRLNVSQWLRFEVICWLVDTKLSKRYEQWLDGQIDG